MSTQIILLELNNTDDPPSKQFLSLISVKRHQSISKLSQIVDKKLSLFSELLIRIHACETLNTTNDEIHFYQNKFGKPYLIGVDNYHFNISHTHNAVAVIFSDTEIGIDIERVKHADLRIANRFFISQEQEYIEKSANAHEAFYEIWTKKESYIKYIGKGLSHPLNSFDVLNYPASSLLKALVFKPGITFIAMNFKNRVNSGRRAYCNTFNRLQDESFVDGFLYFAHLPSNIPSNIIEA